MATPAVDLLREESARPVWLAGVEGLRAIALTLVFLTHFHGQLPGNSFSSVCIGLGPLGTNIFLCLAGFFAWRSQVFNPRPYGAYLAAKVTRVLPLYWTILNVYLLVGVIFPERLGLPDGRLERIWVIAKNALLLAPVFGEQPLMDVTWALTFIIAFQAVCPALAKPLLRLPPVFRLIALAACFVLITATRVLPARSELLVAGALLCEASRHRVARVMDFLLPAAFLGTLLANQHLALVAGAVVICWRVIQSPPSWLSHSAARWIGRHAYAFYLCHGMPIIAFSMWIVAGASLWQMMALMPVVFGASLLCAFGFHHWSERLRYLVSGMHAELPAVHPDRHALRKTA